MKYNEILDTYLSRDNVTLKKRLTYVIKEFVSHTDYTAEDADSDTDFVKEIEEDIYANEIEYQYYYSVFDYLSMSWNGGLIANDVIDLAIRAYLRENM